MGMARVLVANRGEIALRIMGGAAALGLDTVAVRTADDVDCAHVRRADAVVEVASYTDVDALVAAATSTGCDALHPGYGFASENPELVDSWMKKAAPSISRPITEPRLQS